MNCPLISVLGLAALLSGCGGAAAVSEPTTSQVTIATEEHMAPVESLGGLIAGGTVANFGVHHLSPGFTPDPFTVDVVSGGGIDASSSNAGSACAGYVTGQPDVIVQLDGPTEFLRFAFRAASEGADGTLVINDAEGNWHCNDDGMNLNPVVDVLNAPAGQYDIWVGSYNSTENIAGQLLVTEIPAVMP